MTPLPLGITVPIFRFDYDRQGKGINLDTIARPRHVVVPIARAFYDVREADSNCH